MSDVANEPALRVRDTNFDPEQKLHIPEGTIPGYVLYWFRGEPGRISSAIRKGWEWVTPEEISQYIAAVGIGMDLAGGGSSDMGSKVSTAAQEGVGPDGQYLRLFLMKLKKEYWDEDMKRYIEKKIEPIVDAFKSGMVGADTSGEAPGDRKLRYRPKAETPEMFRKKLPKVS